MAQRLRAQGGYITIGVVDPREKGTRGCPQGCDPPMIFKILPPPKDQEHNSCARCLRCLTYWEVTPQGMMVNMRRPLEAFVVLGPPWPEPKKED